MYIDPGQTITLIYTSLVAESYNNGTIKGMIDHGMLTARFFTAETLRVTHAAVPGGAALYVTPSASGPVLISAIGAADDLWSGLLGLDKAYVIDSAVVGEQVFCNNTGTLRSKLLHHNTTGAFGTNDVLVRMLNGKALCIAYAAAGGVACNYVAAASHRAEATFVPGTNVDIDTDANAVFLYDIR